MNGDCAISINGEMYTPENARISIFDRGFLFGDSVYELVRYFGGVGVGLDEHVSRLAHSLKETRIMGFDAAEYPAICSSLLDELGTPDACVYLQVTRGVQYPRAHAPANALEPTVVAIGSPAPSINETTAPDSSDVILLPDLRRHRCDIKATSLIDNVLAAITAQERQANEPILHVNGFLTEGASSNVFVVIGDALHTPPLDGERPILPGIMRRFILEEAASIGLQTIEAPTSISALLEADEAFITSSRRLLSGISAIDGHPTAARAPGPVTLSIFAALRERLTSALQPS